MSSTQLWSIKNAVNTHKVSCAVYTPNTEVAAQPRGRRAALHNSIQMLSAPPWKGHPQGSADSVHHAHHWSQTCVSKKSWLRWKGNVSEGQHREASENMSRAFRADCALANTVNVPKTHPGFLQRVWQAPTPQRDMGPERQILFLHRGNSIRRGSTVPMVGRRSRFSAERLNDRADCARRERVGPNCRSKTMLAIKRCKRGAWRVQSVEQATLDLGVVSSSPTLGERLVKKWDASLLNWEEMQEKGPRDPVLHFVFCYAMKTIKS